MIKTIFVPNVGYTKIRLVKRLPFLDGIYQEYRYLVVGLESNFWQLSTSFEKAEMEFIKGLSYMPSNKNFNKWSIKYLIIPEEILSQICSK